MNNRNAIAAADAHVQAGLRAAEGGFFAEAIACFSRALATAPNNVLAMYNLGYVSKMAGDFERAEAVFRSVLRLQPRHFGATVNLSNILADKGRFDEALSLAKKALRIDQRAEAHYNMGRILRFLGRPQEAAQHDRTAVRKKPDWALAHWNLALSAFQAGHFAEGLREYQWRNRAGKGRSYEDGGIAWWDGQAQASHLLVRWEQGLGDTIQFARYVSLARERADRITLECQPALLDLMTGLTGADTVVAGNEAKPPAGDFSHQVALMSLPHVLECPTPFAPASPYIRLPSPADIPPSAGLTVGVVWQGNRANENDRFRSLPAQGLAPLLDVPGVRLFSLQMGEPPLPGIESLGERIMSLPGTASAIAALDVVVSVDSALAHLAGCMGKTVLMPLSICCDWRWGATGEVTAWYPSMRIFRQRTEAPEWWRAPVAAIAATLASLAAEK